MSKLIITSYPLGVVGEKSIIFESNETTTYHQVLFDVLKKVFADKVPEVLPKEGDVLNINVIEQDATSSLPRIQHFSLLGELEDELVDVLDAAQEWLDDQDLSQGKDQGSLVNQFVDKLDF